MEIEDTAFTARSMSVKEMIGHIKLVKYFLHANGSAKTVHRHVFEVEEEHLIHLIALSSFKPV